MIISASRNFVFIHLEKCGGTSVESALEPYLDWTDVILGSTEYGERIQSLLFQKYGVEKVKSEMWWKHSTAKDICRIIGQEEWDKLNKISVVRDPIDLMKSMYTFSYQSIFMHTEGKTPSKWKKMLETNYFPKAFPYSEMYVRAYMKSEVEGNGIDGFVSTLINDSFQCSSPQFNRLVGYRGQKDLGLVIDLSQLDSRWQEVLSLASISDNVTLNKLNVSKNISVDTELSPRSIKMIKRHFAIDYQQLPRYTGVEW